MKTQKLNIKEATKMDLVKVLAYLGFIPSKESERIAWYILPLRTGKVPSLKVDKNKNTWYDFTLKQKGNTIDLIVLYKKCSVTDAVAFLNDNSEKFSNHEKSIIDELDSNKVNIVEVKNLENPDLISYLNERSVSLTIARKSCVEVHYKVNNQSHFSIGLKYESGRYVLQNKNFKISTVPEDFCFINNGQPSLVVVQGMFDMMTLKILEPSLDSWADILVLNSAITDEKVIKQVLNYNRVLLFLKMNDSGRRITNNIMENHLNCSDRSDLYLGFEDLNDWLINLYE